MSLAGSNSSGTRSRSVQIGKIFRILARFVQSKQRELIMSVTADLPYDPDALRERYREEREKRLRDDGNEQYVEMKGDYAEFLEDPYVDQAVEREPGTEEVDVVIIGGGFGGLQAGARLRDAGVKDIRIIEKGGDFGGTWY